MSTGVIIGAGIAGIATAIFARQQGLDVVLLERGRPRDCDDHLLWIAPNGLHLLDRIGVLETIRTAAVEQEVMGFASSGLKPLMTLTGKSLRQSCGFPIVAIQRRRLWEILRDELYAIRGKIYDHYALDSIETAGSNLALRFLNRNDVMLANWVIGADGMGSRVRQSFAPKSLVKYQGIRTWLGKSRTSVAKHYIGRTIEAWGDRTRFVLTSMDGEWVHFSALERSQVYETNSAPIAPDTLERLNTAFRGYHCDVQTVLEHAEFSSLVRCNFGVVTNLERCHDGLMAVIGDAAHGMPPNMGQGASLGFEDALWITHELANTKDARLAFERYDQARRGRVAEMRQLANAMNRLFQPEGRWAQVLRDRIAAAVPDRLTAGRMGSLYQPAIPTARSQSLVSGTNRFWLSALRG